MVENIEQIERIVEEKVEFKFRKLNAKDIGPMCKILNKIGFKSLGKSITSEGVMSAIRNATKVDKDGKTTVNKEDLVTVASTEIMLEMLDVFVEKIPLFQNELNMFLASLTNTSVEIIENLDLITYVELIKQFFNQSELLDFFKVASKFVN